MPVLIIVFKINVNFLFHEALIFFTYQSLSHCNEHLLFESNSAAFRDYPF